MRYLLTEFQLLIEYIAKHKLQIFCIDNHGNSLKTLDKNQLEKLLQPNIYLGEVWNEYILISTQGLVCQLGIESAVQKIEAGLMADSFLIASYYDDDIVLVSNKILPFLKDCDEASWWKPIV